MDEKAIIQLTNEEQTKVWWDMLKIAHDLRNLNRRDLEMLADIISMALSHWHSEASGGGGYWPPPLHEYRPITGSPVAKTEK